MGPATNPMAVVDERLRVHGVDRLRVIDASVMPKVVAGKNKNKMLRTLRQTYFDQFLNKIFVYSLLLW